MRNAPPPLNITYRYCRVGPQAFGRFCTASTAKQVNDSVVRELQAEGARHRAYLSMSERTGALAQFGRVGWQQYRARIGQIADPEVALGGVRCHRGVLASPLGAPLEPY